MLDLKVYSKAELVEIFGTEDTQGLKRKMQRYGIEFQTAGRGDNLTFDIIKTADPFKVFCIDELGYDGRTDFRKLREFLYCFTGFDDMITKSKSIVKREPNEHFRKFILAFFAL